jgi:hypothetical protein
LENLHAFVHSKNAGSFELTFDMMFATPEVYERVRIPMRSPAKSSPPTIVNLPSDEVKFFACDNALAFKASIPRPIFQGDPLDSDNHGGQQYAPLMDIDIPGF